jgi:CPA1 family monovalent cation:H+ antiporter
MARREEIITVSFAVVAFSIFVQGLTMPPLLRLIGELPPHHNREDRTPPRKMRQGA